MIKYSEEIMKKSFTADSMKAAYLTAAKWVSTNVISKDELPDVFITYKKDHAKQSPTIVVTLHTFLDETELRSKHCQICQETHKAFFINENFNCDRCIINAYQRRADEMLRTKTEHYKRKLKSFMEVEL